MKYAPSKIEKEKKIVALMISLYCRKTHRGRQLLCDECQELLVYAHQRIDQCPFMETKTFCSSCKVHCYRRDMREKIRRVMRFSGPRMLLHHPIIALLHVFESTKELMKKE